MFTPSLYFLSISYSWKKERFSLQVMSFLSLKVSRRLLWIFVLKEDWTKWSWKILWTLLKLNDFLLQFWGKKGGGSERGTKVAYLSTSCGFQPWSLESFQAALGRTPLWPECILTWYLHILFQHVLRSIHKSKSGRCVSSVGGVASQCKYKMSLHSYSSFLKNLWKFKTALYHISISVF